uniref:Uncharacterized protein n=1 Tax=Thermosporothrix sp. COM3 TaxID=2490863 RepID=A0A455SJL5_9CHLR|nr:hypothetical protein KTC_25410 [Thermosporothrix sp. COM3]
MLKNGWISFDLGEVRPCKGTYSLYSYIDLPPLPETLFRGEFQWLTPIDVHTFIDLPILPEEEAELQRTEAEWMTQLQRLVASAKQFGLTLPPDFLRFMSSPTLIRRIPSCTDCYFDLPEQLVRLPGSKGSFLFRFLNDQQSIITWYLLLTPHKPCSVVCSPYRLDAFATSDHTQKEIREVLASTYICAPSFEAFLYRFWLENVIWYKLHLGTPTMLSQIEQRYIEHYAALQADPTKKQHREVLAHALQAAGWTPASGDTLDYHKEGIQLVITIPAEEQPHLYLSIKLPKQQRLHLRIDYREEGQESLFNELLALQAQITPRNIETRVQELISTHSEEIVLETPDEWRVLNAIDQLERQEQAEEHSWYQQGLAYKAQGRYREAAAAFQKQTRETPDMAEIWHNLGATWLLLGAPQQAREALLIASQAYQDRLERYPYNAYNCFWLACVFSLLKEKGDALDYLARAIEVEPSYQYLAQTETDLHWLRQDANFLHLVND